MHNINCLNISNLRIQIEAGAQSVILSVVVTWTDTWWIGGHCKSGVWLWYGILTGKIPDKSPGDTHWYFDPNKSKNDCAYMWTDGNDDISDDGWFSNYNACDAELKYICEKELK